MKQDKSDLAEADFNRAVAIDQKYATQIRSLKTLANVEKILGKNKQTAATTSKPAASQAPTVTQPTVSSSASKPADFQKLGTDRMIVGDTDGAIAQYSACIRQFGNVGTYDCYISRAFAYKQKGSAELAFADLAKAIEIDGVSARAYYQRAEMYYSMNEYAKSIPDYSAAIKADPKQMSTLFARGIAYQRLDKHSLALLDFTEAIRLYPSANYYAFRGMSHKALKNNDDAFADFAIAISKDPKNYTAFYHRGTLHLSKGDRDKAVADFRSADRGKTGFPKSKI
ncbi:MAG: tetratricopeptide repeat protein [Pyrinomonadaceae bacterium]